MKHFHYISALFLLMLFMSACQKYEVVPDEEAFNLENRHETIVDDNIYELDDAYGGQSLRDGSGRPDGGDGITDDDDDDDDSEENQDKSIN